MKLCSAFQTTCNKNEKAHYSQDNMKLELKHLAPYLPYGLKIWDASDETINLLIVAECDIEGVGDYPVDSVLNYNCKPILRPLSDLKLTDYNFSEYMVILGSNYQNGIRQEDTLTKGIQAFTLDDLEILLKNHFDVFGLIPAGLAIDMNTIKSA